MSAQPIYAAVGGFADLWLYAGREHKQHLPGRDFRADVVAKHACATCGAPAGELCHRPTVTGVSVARRLPHFGRGPVRHNVTATHRSRGVAQAVGA
jgi:hypothetical protein